MRGEEFEEKHKNYKWFYLLKVPKVREFVNSYNNRHTKKLVCKAIDVFTREVQKDNPEFKISDLFSLSPIEARKLIWRIVQRTMNKGKSNAYASQIRTFVSLLYNDVLEESGKSIVWKRKHRISTISVRKKKVPSHAEIMQMIDFSHLRDKAMIYLSYCTGLKAEALRNLDLSDLKPLLEDFRENKTEPLVLTITQRHYPKRFLGNGVNSYHALIPKDCAKVLLKYYDKKRKEASDSEPFFITQRNERVTIQRFSTQINYLVKKLDKMTGGDRTNVRASLLRDAFYNRLISGGMTDAHREYLMMHSSIRSHYFNWEVERESIIEEYMKCNFNRTTENNEVKHKVRQQETEIETLRARVKELEALTETLKSVDVNRLLELAKKIEPKANT